MAAAANAKALLPVPGPNRATRRAAATAAAATDAPPTPISLPSASEDASNSPPLSSAATSTHVSAAPLSHISSGQDSEDDEAEADEQEFDEDGGYEEEEGGSIDESEATVKAFGLGDGESDTMDLEAFLADPQAVAALRSKMMVALASQHKRAFPEAGEAIDAALSAADPMAGWGSEEAEEEEEEGVDGEFEEGEFDEEWEEGEEGEFAAAFAVDDDGMEDEAAFGEPQAPARAAAAVTAAAVAAAPAKPAPVQAAKPAVVAAPSKPATSRTRHPGRSEPAVVVLKADKARLFQTGSPMVFSGAIDNIIGRPPPVAGESVILADRSERVLAWGVFNPTSMFQVRIMQMRSEFESPGASDCYMDMPALIAKRIGEAVQLRRLLGLPSAATNVYRLLNSEGDGLSGIIADVLGDTVVVQSSAAWVERYSTEVVLALRHSTGLSHVVWRASEELLREEGITTHTHSQQGQSHAEGDSSTDESSSSGDGSSSGGSEEGSGGRVAVKEAGLDFLADPEGQKTGFYADQRDSRAFIAGVSRGRSVLDLCCYSGGFALSAAAGGASRAVGVDSSAGAIHLATANAAANGLSATASFQRADVSDYMKQAVADLRSAAAAASAAQSDTAGSSSSSSSGGGAHAKSSPAVAGSPVQWDIVVLDPPKLAPTKASLPRARMKYVRLNTMAMQLVAPGGLLMTCSCSGAMTQSNTFLEVLQEAAKQAGRSITVIRTAGPGPDHVLNPAYGEGSYLTNITLRVL
ncbi:MAG: hypothetical protein WDW36_007015 [Sanguina aurantia]